MGFMPKSCPSAVFTGPSDPRSMERRPVMTTQDRKCGRYEMVCTVFLKGWKRISLSSMARMIGAGKPKMIRSPEMMSVLRIRRQK